MPAMTTAPAPAAAGPPALTRLPVPVTAATLALLLLGSLVCGVGLGSAGVSWGETLHHLWPG